MKKRPDVSDSTLQRWHRRQNVFLGIIIATFVIIGYMTVTQSSAQTTQPTSPTQSR